MAFLDDLAQIQSLDKKSKFSVGLILLVTFFLGVIGAAFYWGVQTIPTPPPTTPTIVSQPTLKPLKKAALSLSPKSAVVKAGETLEVDLNINTGDYQVEAADMVLTFDPTLLTATNIEEGEFFPVFLKKDIEAGSIKLYAAFGIKEGKDKPESPKKGSGKVAKITLKALTSSPSAKVIFVKNSTIVASKGNDVLEKAVDGEYKIL